MSKIIILFQDDWELKGNGVGNVADLQYLPLLFLLDLAKTYNIKLNFMVEVLQQIAFRTFSQHNRNIKIQANLWDECVLMMKERGHDVQLHLHPQWHQCRYERDFFLLNDNWNIATYPSSERKSMIESGVAYLIDLITPIDPSYRVIAFKAGSWALQPSKGILEELESFGIPFVLAPGIGIKHVTDKICINYNDLEETTLPYYPNYLEIQKLSHKKEYIIILPLPFYKLNARAIWGKIKRFLGLPKIEYMYSDANMPNHITGNSPISSLSWIQDKLINNFSAKTFDLPTSSLEEMKAGFDQLIYRVLNTGNQLTPIVLQSHTKHYHGNYENMRRFIEYLFNRYGDIISFWTFTELLSKKDNFLVRANDKKEKSICE